MFKTSADLVHLYMVGLRNQHFFKDFLRNGLSTSIMSYRRLNNENRNSFMLLEIFIFFRHETQKQTYVSGILKLFSDSIVESPIE